MRRVVAVAAFLVVMGACSSGADDVPSSPDSVPELTSAPTVASSVPSSTIASAFDTSTETVVAAGTPFEWQGGALRSGDWHGYVFGIAEGELHGIGGPLLLDEGEDISDKERAFWTMRVTSDGEPTGLFVWYAEYSLPSVHDYRGNPLSVGGLVVVGEGPIPVDGASEDTHEAMLWNIAPHGEVVVKETSALEMSEWQVVDWLPLRISGGVLRLAERCLLDGEETFALIDPADWDFGEEGRQVEGPVPDDIQPKLAFTHDLELVDPILVWCSADY